MAKVNFIHICEKAFNGATGNLNIIEIFENISSNSFPAVHPFFSLVAGIEDGEDKRKEISVKMFKIGETKVLLETTPIIVSSKKSFIIQNFVMTEFNTDGVYEFKVYCNGEYLESTKISVDNIN